MVLTKKSGLVQDTYVYNLVYCKTIVYIGITNDPKRRLEEHKGDGKVFTNMIILNKRAMKKENAERIERRLLREFRNKYDRLPKYNVSHNGQYIYGPSKAIQRKIVKRVKEVNKVKGGLKR